MWIITLMHVIYTVVFWHSLKEFFFNPVHNLLNSVCFNHFTSPRSNIFFTNHINSVILEKKPKKKIVYSTIFNLIYEYWRSHNFFKKSFQYDICYGCTNLKLIQIIHHKRLTAMALIIFWPWRNWILNIEEIKIGK